MMPRIPEELPITQAFNDDIRAHGIRQPLLVDAEMQILDGRRRWELARELGLEVEVVVCEDSPLMAVLGSLTQRLHLTKGQLAYTAYPLLKPALEEAKARHLAMLKSGGKSRTDSIGHARCTIEDLCLRLGFSKDTFDQARQVQEAAELDEDLRVLIEESLFIKGSGLGGILAGLPGREATKGKERGSTQLALNLPSVYNACETFAKRWSRPEIFGGSNLAKTREKLDASFSKLPNVALEEIARSAKKALKEVADGNTKGAST